MSYKGHEYFAEVDGNQSIDNGKLGRKLAKGGGGGGSTTSTSTNMPTYAKPYYQELLKQTGMNVFDTVSKDMVGQINPQTGIAYTDKDIGDVTGVKTGADIPQQRAVGFTDAQTAAQQGIAGLQTPGGFATAAQGLGTGQNLGYGMAGAGINQALNYQPGTITADQVRAPGAAGASMQAATAAYDPNLQYFQMTGPQDVSAQAFDPNAVQSFMNPYQQNVTETALREARLQGDLRRQQQALGSIGRGTFGGARQALVQAEQDRNLANQLSDIQYKGSSDAYTQAMSQFNADREAKMRAALANQQAGLTTGQQNLQANLATQQLGTQSGLQAMLANLSNQQQANVQNLAATLQTQGLNSEQALKAALANQQSNLTASTATEQANQFGANLGKDVGLAGLTAGLQASAQQAQVAADTQIAELQRLAAQAASGAEQQALLQKIEDVKYQNAMAQENYEKQQLQFYSDILRGNAGALGSTAVQYAPPPSAVSQVGGLGLAGLGLAKAMG